SGVGVRCESNAGLVTPSTYQTTAVAYLGTHLHDTAGPLCMERGKSSIHMRDIQMLAGFGRSRTHGRPRAPAPGLPRTWYLFASPDTHASARAVFEDGPS